MVHVQVIVKLWSAIAPTKFWIILRQRPSVRAVGAVGCCLDIFPFSFHLFFLRLC